MIRLEAADLRIGGFSLCRLSGHSQTHRLVGRRRPARLQASMVSVPAQAWLTIIQPTTDNQNERECVSLPKSDAARESRK